jgi:hypothetical protein
MNRESMDPPARCQLPQRPGELAGHPIVLALQLSRLFGYRIGQACSPLARLLTEVPDPQFIDRIGPRVCGEIRFWQDATLKCRLVKRLHTVKVVSMRLLFSLIAHLLVTFARLARPGGLGAVAAESLAVKHQLLIMKRARGVPNLTSWDRLARGVCTLLVSPKRLSKIAVIFKPSTLLCLHREREADGTVDHVLELFLLGPDGRQMYQYVGSREMWRRRRRAAA